MQNTILHAVDEPVHGQRSPGVPGAADNRRIADVLDLLNDVQLTQQVSRLIGGQVVGEPVDVEINGRCIGRLQPNAEAGAESWFVQTLHYSASEGSLNPNDDNSSTSNTIQIPGKNSALKFDKFYVQNITVLYKMQFDP